MAHNIHPSVDPARLERALSRLADRDREALLLKLRDGLAYSAIGERLGVSAARAEAHVVHALIKLDAACAREPRPWWRPW